MKTTLFFVSLFCSFTLASALTGAAHAQQASEGKAVVSHGFENSKSVRFGLLRGYDVGFWFGDDYHYVDSVMDLLGVNAVENYDLPVPSSKLFYDQERVVCAPDPWDNNYDTNIDNLAWKVRQRIYTPSPNPIFGDELGSHHFRYNAYFFDSANAVWHDNTYDTNDINPYMEYPANHAYVIHKFRTLRYPGHDSLVYDGNEGRVVLGYSDDRNAAHLLTTPAFYPFRSNPPHPDTAKAFSVNLEFWIDTTAANIDTTDSYGASLNNLPLVRLQVLYKKPNQSVLPFVPFTNGSDTNHGWFECLDTVVTRSIYNSLPDDWRADDSTFVGTVGQRAYNWRFKQLHAMIKLSNSMIATMSQRVDNTAKFGPTNNSPTDFGRATLTTSAPFDSSSYLHPDSMVTFGTSRSDTGNQFIEIRVLTTYRTDVRVRDVTYEDTIVDRYLNRRRFGDSTHSVEQNGTYGGNDDEVNAALSAMAALMGTNRPRELLYNDNGGSPGDAFPMMGYLDYMGSKYQIYVHTRPQDLGNISEVFRRARMSFDGQPPSIFESQQYDYNNWVLPYDYVYYGHPIERDSAWGHSPLDTLMGQVIARAGDTTLDGPDTLVGYQLFERQQAEQEIQFQNIRAMARVALCHPWSKRFAPEYSVHSFTGDSTATITSGGQIHWQGYYYHWTHNGIPDSAWILPKNCGYCRRSTTYSDPLQGWSGEPPYTPETITTIIYGSFANGLTSFSACEAMGNNYPDNGGASFGIFAPAPHSDSNVLALGETDSYNMGHYHTCRDWHFYNPYGSDQDGPLQNYYLGLSNTYRAFQQANNRMNEIWDTGVYPVKNFRWLDSYLNDRCAPYGRLQDPDALPWESDYLLPMMLDDSISKASAFLKVLKTVPVNPWSRNPDSSYRDLSAADPDSAAYVQVGLFIDSISSSQKNYAALVINPRCWPDRDSATIAYYNNGLDSISWRHPTLGDIDVRKVYMKLDLSKTDPDFSNHTYYVVRDLWHPDSTWLLDKDSTFAIYIQPGDAKFLYFEPGIAVNVAAQSATDTGHSSQNEFCFNNGRRVAEIEHHSHDVVTYTRNNHLYVAYPAEGNTFGASSDLSSGDNIITGYEQALDTTHFCARPSIAVAPNDTGVALTYWYKDASGNGHLATFENQESAIGTKR